MSLISLRQLLEAGVHFGHPTRKWNPKMKPYIYTERNGIHILDLQKTIQMIEGVHEVVKEMGTQGKCILLVGTKSQAQEVISEEAKRCGSPYVNKRWLGGLLTNHSVMEVRLARLRELRKMKDEGSFEKLRKVKARSLQKELDKLARYLGGIETMNGLPDALFIIDTKKERIAVAEAIKKGIPIISVIDTNCDPDEVDYKIAGNDDAIRSIKLFCSIIADSYLEGKSGVLPPDSVFLSAEHPEEATGIEMSDELVSSIPREVVRERIEELKESDVLEPIGSEDSQ